MDGPADTRMMGIVHDALRRDFGRLRSALTTPAYPDGERRAALAGHALWMLDFLHTHHHHEDVGLYPMVIAANPGSAEVLARMDADHKQVVPAMEALRSVSERWGRTGNDADREAMVAAIDALLDVLVPHLEREENDAMPVVSASISQREWHAWDQKSNVKSKSLPKLAEEGNWLIDGLDPARRAIVEAEVPAIPRFIVLYGFGPGYRRRAALRWGSVAP
jgi:hypothetical protein